MLWVYGHYTFLILSETALLTHQLITSCEPFKIYLLYIYTAKTLQPEF